MQDSTVGVAEDERSGMRRIDNRNKSIKRVGLTLRAAIAWETTQHSSDR